MRKVCIHCGKAHEPKYTEYIKIVTLFFWFSSKGCTVKPKLMGGWKKQKNSGNIAAFAYITVSTIHIYTIKFFMLHDSIFTILPHYFCILKSLVLK